MLFQSVIHPTVFNLSPFTFVPMVTASLFTEIFLRKECD